MERTWQVYLSGEIHSDWRERIEAGTRDVGLPVECSAPVTDHEAQRRPARAFWEALPSTSATR